MDPYPSQSLGVRIVYLDGDASPPAGSLRNGIVLYIHDPENVAYGDPASGTAIDPGESRF